MLESLPTIGENHLMQREHLIARHSRSMNKILRKNSDVEKYWILGWVESKRRNGQTKIQPKMMVLYEKPELKKESYLYEIDNKEGSQTLLWVMHPNNKLDFPPIGKTIHVAGESGG